MLLETTPEEAIEADKRRARWQAYYAKNKDILSAKNKEYRLKNAERLKQREKARRETEYYKEYRRAWWASDKGRAIRNANNRQSYAKTREFLREYLATHPCVDCGISDVRVLEFDHRPGTKKRFNVAGGYHSVKGLMREIEKCDVRCANCHSIATWERRQQWTS